MKAIRYGGAVTGFGELWAIMKSVVKSTFTRQWQAGEEAKKFEQELADYVGTKHAILTTSGSCAGLLALSALELEKGSEVIIPAVTFPTIFNIIVQCGLVPVVADVEIGTYNLDLEKLERAISPKTKAIIAVHAVGNPANVPEIMEIAKRHNLIVLEDNCDGLGSEIGGKKVGSFGDISFTSLHAAHIVSMGVGGAIFTDSDELARNVRMYRDWGRQAEIDNKWNGGKWPELPADQDARFIYEKIGYNFQILELQAAMGRVQLRKIQDIKNKRQTAFNVLYVALSKYEDLILPKWQENADVCWFSFPLSTRGDRTRLLLHLENCGIETRSMFSGRIDRHPAYKNVEMRVADATNADWILEHSFWISCHPSLTSRDIKRIIRTFDEYYASAPTDNTNRADQ